MKKFVLFFMIVILLFSCNIIKTVDIRIKANRMMKQTTYKYYYNNPYPFIFDGKSIMISSKVNNKDQMLIYNSSMQTLLLKYVNWSDGFHDSKHKVSFRFKNRLNQPIFVKAAVGFYNIETDFFSIANLVGEMSSFSNDSINAKSNSQMEKISIGTEVLLNNNNAFSLNFSDTTITIFDYLKNYDLSDYSIVQTLNTCNGFNVGITIDSIKYTFIFDTNNPNFLTLPLNKKYQKCITENGCVKCYLTQIQYEKHKKENDISIVQIEKRVGFEYVDSIIKQDSNSISFGNLESLQSEIFFSNEVMYPIMGLKFISQFDWIIDIFDNKIYLKKLK